MNKILVTRPFFPPQEEYALYLNKIWKNQWLTNMGPLALELEEKLKDFMDIKNLIFVSNGTIALHMAIRALGLKGEVITTPFSFVATTNSVVWEGCIPVFVDIERDNLNIDPNQIEAAITEKTSAILATHIFGNPCDVEAIQQIADKYNLKVIYDGAHAFNIKLNGKSIFDYGDVTTCSFHATKFYHTGEGGMVITNNSELLKKMRHIRNHGFDETNGFASIGTNAKNSELHAALGIVNLKYVPKILAKRKKLTEIYENRLQDQVMFQEWNQKASRNYGYLPVVFEVEEQLLDVKSLLEDHQIFTRRYFYPSLASSLPYMTPVDLPITKDISKRCLCLPLYFDLSESEVNRICDVVLDALNASVIYKKYV